MQVLKYVLFSAMVFALLFFVANYGFVLNGFSKTAGEWEAGEYELHDYTEINGSLQSVSNDGWITIRNVNRYISSLRIVCASTMDIDPVVVYLSEPGKPGFSEEWVSVLQRTAVGTYSLSFGRLPDHIGDIRVDIGNLPGQEFDLPVISAECGVRYLPGILLASSILSLLIILLMEQKLDSFLDLIIRHRYRIGLPLFGLLVALSVHGSSIGIWSGMVESVPTSDTTFWGGAQAIRSDEWLAQTPMHLAQLASSDPFSLINPNIGLSGKNMAVATFAPIKSITVLLRPPVWGFLLFGRDAGLAWFWWIRFFVLFFALFEFLNNLGVSRTRLAFLLGLMLVFSPALMWWGSTSLVDSLAASLSFVVLLAAFLRAKKKWIKAVCAFAGSICAGWFILCLYPPFQVPIGYMTLVLIFWTIFTHRDRLVELRLRDYLILAGAVLFLTGLLVLFFYNCRDALETLMGTAYPGRREAVGGSLNRSELPTYLSQAFLPYIDPASPLTNQCAYSLYHLSIFTPFILLPFHWRHIERKIRLLVVSLSVLILVELGWMLLPVPPLFAKITLLSYVPPSGMITITGFTAVLVVFTILLGSRSEEAAKHSSSAKSHIMSVAAVIAAVGFTLLSLSAHNEGMYGFYLNKAGTAAWIVAAIVHAALLFGLCTRNRGARNTSLIIFAILTIAGGATVNPLSIGTRSVYDKPIVSAIEEIREAEPDSIWVASGNLIDGNFLIMNGVHSLNSVHYYPDLPMWRIADPTGKDEAKYNRFTHVVIQIDPTTVEFMNPQADVLVATVNHQTLLAWGVDYIMSSLPLDEQDSALLRFETVYDSAVSDVKIFKVVKTPSA